MFPLALVTEINEASRLLAAKAYLEEIRKYREMEEKYNSAVEFYKRKAYSIGGYKYNETKVQTSIGEKGAAYEHYLMKLEELKKTYYKNFFPWKCKALNPLISIGKINNLDYQYLLWMRFSSYKSWEEIQDGLQCENVHEVRNQALLALSYVMEQEGKLQIYANKL